MSDITNADLKRLLEIAKDCALESLNEYYNNYCSKGPIQTLDSHAEGLKYHKDDVAFIDKLMVEFKWDDL